MEGQVVVLVATVAVAAAVAEVGATVGEVVAEEATVAEVKALAEPEAVMGRGTEGSPEAEVGGFGMGGFLVRAIAAATAAAAAAAAAAIAALDKRGVGGADSAELVVTAGRAGEG